MFFYFFSFSFSPSPRLKSNGSFNLIFFTRTNERSIRSENIEVKRRETLTHDLELDDVAGSVALDVAGYAGVVACLRPIDLSQGEALLLNDHAHLDVVLKHVSLFGA